MAEEQPTPAIAARPRRRWPWIVAGLIAVVVLLVAAAPMLLSGFLGSQVEASFARDHRGRLELGALKLGWFSPMRVENARLLDPSGAEVARASVDLPSLAALAGGGGKKLGKIVVVASAQLTADDAGTTNLQRALEATDEAKKRAASESKKPSEPTDLGKLLRELDVDLEVRVTKLTWADAHTRALGKPFELADLVATVTAKPGQPLALEVNGKLASEDNVPLKASARVTDLFAGSAINPKARFELSADVQSLPSGLIDALSGQVGLVTALFGERMNVAADGQGTLTDGKVDLSIAGARGKLTVAAQLAGGVLTGVAKEALSLESKPEREAFERWLSSGQAGGAPVAAIGEPSLSLVAENLRVDVERVLGAASAHSDVVAAAALATEFDLRVASNAWSLPERKLELREPHIAVHLAPSGESRTLAVDADVKVAGGADGPLSLALRCNDVAQLLAIADGGRKPAAEAKTEGRPLELTLRSEPQVWRELLRPFLPDGLALELGNEIRVALFDGDSAIPRERLAAARSTAELVTALLQELDARADVFIDRVALRNAKLAAKDRWLRFKDVALNARISHEQSPDPVSAALAATIDDPRGGPLHIAARCPDVDLEHLTDPLELQHVVIELDASSFPGAWLDDLAAGDGSLVAQLGDQVGLKLTCDATQTKDALCKLALDASVAGGRKESKLVATASVADPLQRRAARPAGALPELDASFTVTGTELALGFAPASVAPTARELVGDTLQGQLSCHPANGSKGLDDATLAFGIKAARVDLMSAARIQGGQLRMHGTQRLALQLHPTPALLDRYVAASLPQGAKLAFAEAEPVCSLTLSEVDLPLDAWLPAEGKAPAELADVVRRTAAKLALAPPSLRYEQPPLTAGAQSVPIDVDQLAVAATLAPAKPATAKVSGHIGGAKGGKLNLDASCADAGAFVAENAALPPLELNGDIAGLPTALIDALAAQNGLLVDTLGPTVDLKVAGKLAGPTNEPLRAELRSANASLDLVALLNEQTVVATGKQGLDATVPLSPLFSQRVVGNLVPLLVNATKPEGAKPVALGMTDFALPLDGDLRKLDATVRLDLGEVVYDLLPGLSTALASAGVSKVTQQKFTLAPMTIPIKDGVARYDNLALSIGGETVAFKGSFDLATREMALSTQVPLKALGSKVEKELENVRQYLDPNLLVPIEIKGAWNKPKITLGKEFMDKVVKNAAENAVKGGLLDLLDKKKKKN